MTGIRTPASTLSYYTSWRSDFTSLPSYKKQLPPLSSPQQSASPSGCPLRCESESILSRIACSKFFLTFPYGGKIIKTHVVKIVPSHTSRDGWSGMMFNGMQIAVALSADYCVEELQGVD